MAITVGNTSNSGVLASVNSSTHSHANNGEDVFVMVALRDARTAATISSVTYAGVTMNQDKSQQNLDTDSSSDLRVYIFSLLGASSGANNVVVTFSGTVDHAAVFAISANDLDSSQPDTANSSYGYFGSDPSTSVTTISADTIIFDVVYNKTGNALTQNASQTSIGNLSPNGGGDRVGASYKIVASSGGHTMSWTTASGGDQDDWVQVVVAYKKTVTVSTPPVTATIQKKKEILYKVFNSVGTFLRTWVDVVSELNFKWTINGGLSNITIRLARPENSFGENDDVKQGNVLNVYVFDEESGVNGVLVYSGILVSYVPQVIGGREYVDVEFFSHYWELKNKILESGGNTEVAYASKDPGFIMRALLDLYAGTIDYATGTVDDTSTTVSYTFNTVDYQSAVSKVLELCPDGWFYRVGADSILYMEAREVDPSHYFTIGREIMEYYPEKRSEGVVNIVYFRGGSTLYKKYTSTSSVSTYGTRAITVIDERVTVEATADIIADRILDAKASPEIRVVLKIMDSNGQDNEKGYDIESIKPGQTCKILNATSKSENLWDISLWDGASWDYDITNASATQLQIMSVEYHLDYAVVELSNRQPDIAKRIEDINRNVTDSITIDNPAAPTT